MESDIIKIKHVKGCFCLFFVGGMPGRNKNTCLKLDIDKKNYVYNFRHYFTDCI